MAVNSSKDGHDSKMSASDSFGDPACSQLSPFQFGLHSDDHELQQLRVKVKRLEEENQTEIDANDELRKRVNQLENEKLKFTSSSNEEVSELQTQVARLRAEVERSRAAFHQLEYEMVVAKRAVSVEKSAASEREDGLSSLIETHKERNVELASKLQDLQASLVTQRRFAEGSDAKHRRLLEEREKELQTARAELDVLNTEKQQLEQVFHEQENIYAETRDKVTDLTLERDTQTNTVRQQLREIQHVAEREDRLKKELEVAIGKIRALEETVEAERAAHLESKFNSELIQLRVRDLQGALDVEKSAHSEVEHNVDIFTKQLKDLEVNLERERIAAGNARQQVESLTRDNDLLNHRLSAEVDSKQTIVSNLSTQLEAHQKNFDELKEELAKAKKRQIYLEETYGGSMQELDLLLHNFQLNGEAGSSSSAAAPARRGKPRRDGVKNGRSDSTKKAQGSSPLLVLETLRTTLRDYQKRLEHTSQELGLMKTRCEKMTAECEKYKEVTWTRSQTVQDLQKKFISSNRECEQLRQQLNDTKSQVTTLKMELQKVTHREETEGSRAADLMDEYGRRLKEAQDEEEKRRIYLHSLYQRIMSGRSVLDPPKEPVLSSFTWEELSIAVQDQVVGLMTGLNRANEKSSHLETVIHNKDELLRDVQHSHEESLERLAEAGREREREWHRQRVVLEEEFSQQLAGLQVKSQKTQTLADQAWDKARLTGAVQQGLEAECAQLRGDLTQTGHDRSCLVLGCCLLAGALLPLLSRYEQLASQRNALEEQVKSLEVMRKQAQDLARTLTLEEETEAGSEPQPARRTGRNLLMVFRKAAIAVIAANRLVHLGKCSHRIFTAVDNPYGIHSVAVCLGDLRPLKRQFNGVSSFLDGQSTRNRVEGQVSDWFTGGVLTEAVTESCSELHGILRQEAGTSQPQTVSAVARTSFIKLMSKLAQVFQASPLQPPRAGYGHRDRGMLIRLLGYGLSRGIAHSSIAGKHAEGSSQQIMACLQRNLINFTQRLHSAEVERRSLRLQAAKLRQENGNLILEKDRAKEMATEIVQLKDSRENMVMRERFDSVCSELSKALSREQQAQELLNEQSSQLEELGLRLNMYTTEELDRDATITEAVKGLSEAKMELRRKEQTVRQLTKQLSLLQDEKRALQANVQDVQEVLRSTNKEKDKVAAYLLSIKAAVEETKRQVVVRGDNRVIDAALRQVLIHPERHGVDGVSSETVAIKNLTASFVDCLQTVLSRLAALEDEIASNKQHIASLKEELCAACRREYPEEEPQHLLGRSQIPDRTFGRSRPLYETDRSFRDEFVPPREEHPDYSTMMQDASRQKTSVYTPASSTPLATSTQRKSPSKGRNYTSH